VVNCYGMSGGVRAATAAVKPRRGSVMVTWPSMVELTSGGSEEVALCTAVARELTAKSSYAWS